jgi:hypothetical protein
MTNSAAVHIRLAAKGEEHMKTKQEIKEEIIELYAAQKAYSEIVEFAHKQQVDSMKKMMALNQMLKDMDDEEKNHD